MRAPWLFIFVAALFGCQLERFSPDTVALGVARLSVRNAAALTSLANADAKCGFASPEVIARAGSSGTPGGQGSVTYRIEGCVLDLGELHQVSEDCTGTKSELGGRAVVSGTMTVEGLLTGNPQSPVVPDGPEATRIELSAELDGFVVRRSNSPNVLTQKKGKLSWVARPHLALSASKGVCAVSTSDITLADLSYDAALVRVKTADRDFEVEVPSSKLAAQMGRWGDKENALEGRLTAWDADIALPLASDPKGLDPDYDAEAFRASYACKDDLAQPVRYTCPSALEKVTQGASQLTVSLFGNLGAYVDEDKSCGFASPAVVAAAKAQGTVGQRGGAVTFRIDRPCVLSFPVRTTLRTDCHGVATLAVGTVTVTGTKTVRGIPTGDPSSPIVPTSWEPAEVALNLSFKDFWLSDSASTKSLGVLRGTLSGKSHPRTALDTKTGACSLKTRVSHFEGLSYQSADLVVLSDGNRFSLPVDGSALEAQSGSRAGVTNHLEGTVRVAGATVPVPAKGMPAELDPAYDAARLEASYSCAPDMVVVRGEDACSFHRPLAEAVARLLVLNTATVASLVNSDSRCGFDNTLLKLRPTEVVGSPGQIGRMSWKVDQCELGQAAPKVVDESCVGAKRVQTGQVFVSAQRTVVGEREKTLLLVDSIIPRTRDAVTVSLTQVLFNAFSAGTAPAGSSAPSARLVLTRGTLSATVKPLLGERKSKPNVFDVRTPVVALEDVVLTQARGRIEKGAATFELSLPEVRLSALNGGYGGRANQVSATVRFDDRTVDVGVIPLDPAFAQADFDRSYACTDDLKEVLPSR